MKIFFQGLLIVAICFATMSQRAVCQPQVSPTQYVVVVLDSIARTPVELARVMLTKDKQVIQGHVSDVNGIAKFRDLNDDTYTLSIHAVEYVPFTTTVTISAAHTVDTILLRVQTQEAVVVSVGVIPNISLDLVSGNQQFDATTYHAPPQSRMTNIVQQSVAGAVRAPTGEVHVRGQHGEFTYYIDGMPIPLGVFGGLNEVVDPKVIDHITFLTGGFPAEYGGQMAAVMDVQTRVPSGTFQLDASTYVGSYFNAYKTDSTPMRSLNSNGQSIAISDRVGKLGFFLSASRQETDRRIDPPVPQLFHDHGFDYFAFGKAEYIFDPTQYLSLNLNFGKTATQIPFDPSTGLFDDNQTTSNAFQTLSYSRTFSNETDRESSLLAGVYAREGGLIFAPGTIDPAQFQFAGDTTHNYNLAEDRSFTTLGTRVKYDDRLSHRTKLSTGFTASITNGTEHFTTTDSTSAAGPSVTSAFTGSDFGIFLEAEQELTEWTNIEAGVRYDQHIAPDAPLTSQVSPRIRWNLKFDDGDDAYVYYGRLFMPNNIEGLRTIASNVSSTGASTLPERDHFFEAVYSRAWGAGVTSKLAGFYKIAQPGVDDQTIGSSAIKTPVNIDTVRTSGIELALTFSDPSSPLSAYANASIIHAYGSGAITGGFLRLDSIPSTDLDHDQRLSIVLGANYQPEHWFVNATAIYGSGLTNGNPSGESYKTGLFDFNQFAHTTPSWIVNLSFGYTFTLTGNSTLAPSLYVTNLFDNNHLIKGAFFSNAVWEERRNIVLRLDYHL